MSELQIRKATRKEPTVLAVQLTEENYRYVAAWVNEQIKEIKHRYGKCTYNRCLVGQNKGLILRGRNSIAIGSLTNWVAVELDKVHFLPCHVFDAIYALEPTND